MPYQWPRWVPAVAAGGWQRLTGFAKLRPPASPPIGAYTRTATAPIGNNGIAAGIVGAGGAVTVPVGPSGVGTRWYPQSAVVSTSTGAADTSTCTIYLGALVQANIVGQSYAGGGDTVGLSVPEMQPGDVLFAVWAGGHPGDQATVRVIGDQDVLTPG